MRIVFLSGGARQKSLEYLCKNGANIVGVVTPIPSKANSRFLPVIEVARTYNVPVYEVKKTDLEETLRKIDFDILVSCGFTYILEKSVIEACKYAINVHPTLLPKYRGFRSGPFVILNDERETGVSIHYLTAGMDEGDIILQQRIPLGAFDTLKSIYRKTQEIEPKLLLEAIAKIESNSVNPSRQNEADATTYNQVRTPADSHIDWNKSLKDLYNEIRVSDPVDFPAFFYVEGQKVCIKLWRPDKPADEFDLI